MQTNTQQSQLLADAAEGNAGGVKGESGRKSQRDERITYRKYSLHFVHELWLLVLLSALTTSQRDVFSMACWLRCTPGFCVHLDRLPYNSPSKDFKMTESNSNMFHQTVSRMAKNACQCPLTSLFQAFQLQPTVFVRALSVNKLCCHCIAEDIWNNTPSLPIFP